MYLKIFGLPAHPLVVHATAVLVPLAALVVAAVALWPALHRRLGPLPLGLAAVALALVPLTTSTGDQLEARLPESPLIARHAELADGLLPWVFGLFTVSVFVTWLDRRLRKATAVTEQLASSPAVAVAVAVDVPVVAGAASRSAGTAGTAASQPSGERRQSATATAAAAGNSAALRLVATLLAVVAATGTVVQVVRIGDAGAKAAWSAVPAAPRPDADGG
ncbi:DUF2231 domain-containing protein [Frankia sp. CiP3]|uniref:DUF2231 domain-containing protein n=1 Tax=Frankia sp. CiP3 TaxID=2880971 RepID=UPI001EF72D93|nr:DUF2231 domain-containing protein [Frankia sp. CiP3]